MGNRARKRKDRERQHRQPQKVTAKAEAIPLKIRHPQDHLSWLASGAGFRTFCHSSPQAILVRICLGGDADDLARPFPFILKLGFMFLNDKKSRNNSAEAANNADNSVINKEGWSDLIRLYGWSHW